MAPEANTPNLHGMLSTVLVELMKTRAADIIVAADRATCIKVVETGDPPQVVVNFDTPEHARAFFAAVYQMMPSTSGGPVAVTPHPPTT